MYGCKHHHIFLVQICNRRYLLGLGDKGVAEHLFLAEGAMGLVEEEGVNHQAVAEVANL